MKARYSGFRRFANRLLTLRAFNRVRRSRGDRFIDFEGAGKVEFHAVRRACFTALDGFT